MYNGSEQDNFPQTTHREAASQAGIAAGKDALKTTWEHLTRIIV